jgi:hypothetical protein
MATVTDKTVPIEDLLKPESEDAAPAG